MKRNETKALGFFRKLAKTESAARDALSKIGRRQGEKRSKEKLATKRLLKRELALAEAAGFERTAREIRVELQERFGGNQ